MEAKLRVKEEIATTRNLLERLTVFLRPVPPAVYVRATLTKKESQFDSG